MRDALNKRTSHLLMKRSFSLENVSVGVFTSPFFFFLQCQESVKNELPAIAALQFAICSALELAQKLLYPAKSCSSDYHRKPACVFVCVQFLHV